MLKRILALLLASIMILSVMAGCNVEKPVETPAPTNAPVETQGNNTPEETDPVETEPKEVTITIGNWPSEADEANYKIMQDRLARMNELYPYITVVPQTSSGDVKEYVTLAAAGQLPNLYQVAYTELSTIAKSGFALDITDLLDEGGFLENLNPVLYDPVSYQDRIYAIPTSTYGIGLACNRAVFEAAGLVNADGSLQFPETFDELTQTALKIKEATGQYGIAIASTGIGGWIFTNIAWNYGVDFMEQQADGSWKATFDTPEMIEALQWVYDMKWVHEVLPEDALMDHAGQRKLFASEQCGMYLMHAPERGLVWSYGMDCNNICYGSIPAGPGGRYSLSGGNLLVMSPETTPEQFDAVMKWIDVSGQSYAVTENYEQGLRETYSAWAEQGVPILQDAILPIWINEERTEILRRVRGEYTNIPASNFETYLAFEGVTLKAEEPEFCQELYTILDGVLQEVLANKDVDIPALVTKAANDFQANYLNNA